MGSWVSAGWKQGLLLCVLAVVSLRCEDQVAAPEGGDYLFITQRIFSRQTILEGDPRYIPIAACEMIAPYFRFDPSTKSLRIFYHSPFPIDAGLRSIFWGSGIGGFCPWAGAFPVHELPMQIDSLTVLAGIRDDGDAKVVVKGQLLALSPGSDYKEFLLTRQIEGFYRILPDTTRHKYVLEQTVSLKIHNYGWCPKRLVSFEGS